MGAFTGAHLLDLVVMSSDTVRDISAKIRERLPNPPGQPFVRLGFVNGAGAILRESVRANKINSYKVGRQDVPGHGEAQRVLKLEVQPIEAAGRALPRTAAKAKARASSGVMVKELAEPFGVIFIH